MKYSVLLMRDDQPVRRFRISPALIRAAIYFGILLLLIAVAGLFLSFTFWTKNKDLTLKNETLDNQLQEKQVKLVRLENMDKILKNHDIKDFQNILLTRAQTVDTSSDPIDLDELFDKVDLKLVALKNIKLIGKNKKLILSFDFTNKSRRKPMRGQIDISLITKQGDTFTPKLNHEEVGFVIKNTQKFSITIPYPDAVKKEFLFALRLKVNTRKGKTLYGKTFLFTDIKRKK